MGKNDSTTAPVVRMSALNVNLRASELDASPALNSKIGRKAKASERADQAPEKDSEYSSVMKLPQCVSRNTTVSRNSTMQPSCFATLVQPTQHHAPKGSCTRSHL